LVSEADPAVIARRLQLGGRVQGVGFRPFVYRLARELGLTGYVRNLRGEVEVIAIAPLSAIEAFARAVIEKAPPLARPVLIGISEIDVPSLTGFRIAESSAADSPRVAVPPDFFACDDCLREMSDERDRRFRYPFINCTQCGPRYTLIEALPYDRPNTSMAAFPLCEACRAEYEDPLDRRFHAEPIACPVCGPHLRYAEAGRRDVAGDETSLSAAVECLRAGRILAVRGIGGYHLLCDARSEPAVQRLRERKRRPDKPLAVMYPLGGGDGLQALQSDLQIGDAELAAISDPARPIVLVNKSHGCRLAAAVAPGLAEVGVFLPYSPLHALLLADFGGPLVATSGNVSGEPVLTDIAEASDRLADVADAFLHHDRPIVRPADDSVMRVIAGRARPLRLGRGAAPIELDLPWPLPAPVLAVGGHLKLTVALAWDRRIVISPHIGEMGTLRSERVFEQVVADLPRLYGIKVAHWLCDAHPGYTTSRWLREQGRPVTEIPHHHAHASALMTEHALADELALVLAWDGVGFGEDGTLWGGEAFYGCPGQWQRVASLRPFRLPGGDAAGRAPWRSAAALCWESGLDCPLAIPDPIVRSAWERGINCPQSSAAGRVFDAAAALTLGITQTSFEGQGPMQLEACAASAGDFPWLPIEPDASGLRRIDWRPLVAWLIESYRPVADRAFAVHAALADAAVRLAESLRDERGTGLVGLTGGVFQNRLLSELIRDQLESRGFRVVLARRIPCNDGGLSHGQVAEYAARSRRQAHVNPSSFP
jgi:hydrogenase maturation protein HypF